jgi:hypothetical protein
MADRIKEAAGEILRLARPPSSENSAKVNQVILELLRELPGEAVPTIERLVQELREQVPFMKPEGRQFLERIIAFLEKQIAGIDESG